MDEGVKEELAPDKEEINPVEELKKPSPGQELIERIKKEDFEKKKKKEAEEYVPSIIIDGVEVIDAKAIPKKEKIKLDKFGIPIPENRRTWDKI